MRKLSVFFFLLFLTHLAIGAEEELDPAIQEAVNQTLKGLSQREIAQVTGALQMINEGEINTITFESATKGAVQLSSKLFEVALKVRERIIITTMQQAHEEQSTKLTDRLSRLEMQLKQQQEQQPISIVHQLEELRQKRIGAGELEKVSSV